MNNQSPATAAAAATAPAAPLGLRHFALVRILRRMTVVIAAGLAALLFGALPAQAAGGGFNPVYTYAYTWGDCTIKVGVVRDVYSPWASIGGTTVSCRERHTYIGASVSLVFNGGVISGSTRSVDYGSSYSTGPNIVETGRYCGNGVWSQRAVITVSGLGQTPITTPGERIATGCR